MRFAIKIKITDKFVPYAGTMELDITAESRDEALFKAGRKYEVVGPPAYQNVSLVSVTEIADEPLEVHVGSRCQADIGGQG